MEENKNSLAYQDKVIERVREMLETKVTTYPTRAARMACAEFDLEYNEEIGRWYRAKFQQDTELTNTVSYKAAQKRTLKKSSTYILTSAQNSTAISENLLLNMEKLAKDIDAEIGVIASRYRNPSLFNEGLKENYWDDKVEKYLIASMYQLHKHLYVAADIRVPFTTASPTNTAKKLVGDYSVILGHPKQDLESIPILDEEHEKYVYTTGSITLANNYSDTMSGAHAQRNHKLGFLVVDILDDDEVLVRNVEADSSGNFVDIDQYYYNGNTMDIGGQSVKAYVAGDAHVMYMEKEPAKTLEKHLEFLKPRDIVLHDVLSAESVSRHTIKDVFAKMRLFDKGALCINQEIDYSLTFLKLISQYGNIIIPGANHHYILEGWLTDNDWKKDIVNAKAYLRLSNILASDDFVNNAKTGLYGYLVDQMDIENIVNLSYSESYLVGGIELSQHGDRGVNGMRGSINQYLSTGKPHIIAHLHSPKKIGDVLQVGTHSKRRMSYNKGYSGWRSLNGIITANSKVQYIQITQSGKSFLNTKRYGR